ncbi:MAG: PspC domain-containing protein [Candidatus Eisenbacteria bacterium]|uniref:PspC domain-containing protein n=1 Tax=Eiseniibacteriota bacterium TaxID=2212470 RepID=A0A7Y2E6G0_UNCEI|nr:PspC domain-containing protein [Candidatus Eisenbacteria bacterium]
MAIQDTASSWFRSMTDRRIAGVASGLAFHFGIDVAWVRLGFVLTTFLWGVGILAYAILWVTLPERSVADPEDLLPPLATNEPLQVVGILCLATGLIILWWRMLLAFPGPFVIALVLVGLGLFLLSRRS